MTIMNPYSLYVFCDGAMNYDSKNTGGVGYEIVFPDFIDMENIQESHGRYEGGNIERLELEGLIQGLDAIERLFKKEGEKLRNISSIFLITDRFRLHDKEGTCPYKIRGWRKNKWCNYEGKAIKNHDLLDKLDKKRKKISDNYSKVNIEFRPRKQNKVADKLAKKGKKEAIVNETIAVKGLKVGKRKFNGSEVIYKTLKVKDEIHVHVFIKTPVNDQWEISVEICQGELLGRKLKIYTDNELAPKLKRRNEFIIRIKEVFKHHITIYKTLKKPKIKK